MQVLASVKVDNNNQVLFTYYEKPTSAKRPVMKRSAMAEKATIQVHSNDPIRRFMNTREDLPDGDFCKMTDEYAQKLLNSGFEVPQVRKILKGGIKASGRKLSGTRNKTQEDSTGKQRYKIKKETNWQDDMVQEEGSRRTNAENRRS